MNTSLMERRSDNKGSHGRWKNSYEGTEWNINENIDKQRNGTGTG